MPEDAVALFDLIGRKDHAVKRLSVIEIDSAILVSSLIPAAEGRPELLANATRQKNLDPFPTQRRELAAKADCMWVDVCRPRFSRLRQLPR